MQQQHLMFPDTPCPYDAVWAQLDNEQRAAVLAVLSRLIAQIEIPDNQIEENTDD